MIAYTGVIFATLLTMTRFREMREDSKKRFAEHLDRHGLGGDEAGLVRRRTQVQQATDALDWVASQPGDTATLGCYPVDLAAETEYFERMLDAHPDFRDADRDDFSIPRDQSPEDISRELKERIRDMQKNKPEEEE